MIHLAWPWALAFLPLPLVVFWLLPPARHEEAALQVPFFNVASHYESASGTERRSRVRRLLMVLVWIALVIACARPQWVGEPIQMASSGRDLMLAVDISGSMSTPDMELDHKPVSRLQAVKAILGEFIARRKGDRIGLILFGTRPYVQTPLTFDRDTVERLLADTPVGIAGPQTAIGDAIALAIKRLKSRPAKSRVLILLTDGANNAGEIPPMQAAKIAAEEGIKIYTIGFGATRMQVSGIFFSRTINPSSDLDQTTLTKIAKLTGGVYYRARDTRELANIYKELDKLEPIKQQQETFRPTRSLFAWPLGFALVLSLLMATFNPLTTGWLMSRLPRSRQPNVKEPT